MPRANEEQQFSVDIERLLRGEEPVEASGDADYRETLQFARRLIELRDEPAAEFAAGLKLRLITNMAEQDAMPSGHERWFVRLFARPGLGLAVASTFVVLAIVGLVWRAGMSSPEMPQSTEPALPGVLTVPPTSDAPPPGTPELAQGPEDSAMAGTTSAPDRNAMDGSLAVTAYTATSINSGENVNISIIFSNQGPDGYHLSPFPPSVAIRETATGRVVYTFTAGTTSYPLSALESARYDVVWNQLDNSGLPVQPGKYAVDVEMLQARLEKGDSIEWMVADSITTFDILTPTADETTGDVATQR
ncbi:MAG: hypothetical protein JXA58_04485 [Dehalococcoidia bacterium]|nr:hypothetical protein [Dehalococcoidia bacterium]